MGLFGLFSKKNVEEEVHSAREALKQEQQSNLSNLAKGSQIDFVVSSFDVFDPHFDTIAVPVYVCGKLVYGVNDIAQFNSINKTENVDDDVFRKKLEGQVTKYVKGVVTNAPAEHQIPVLQLERKIIEISELVQKYVTPQIERLFGINVRSLDITEINIKKESRGYRELKAVTTELERKTIQTRSNLSLDAMSGQEEMQRMQLEHQRETMRIQREELQRASRLQTETNFLSAHQANLNADVQTAQARMAAPQMLNIPPMPGVGGMPPMPGSVPQVSYMVGVNGQQLGPCNWEQLRQMVQQGQLTHQTFVWKQGMPQWMCAGEVQELTPLFQNY